MNKKRLGGRAYAVRCHVCKRKKVKCDGNKPSCLRCLQSGVVCTGYERPLEFNFYKPDQSDSRALLKTATLATRPFQSNPKVEERHGGLMSVMGAGTISHIHSTPIAESLNATQYMVAFVDGLQDRYIPDLPNNPDGIATNTSWILAACELASYESSSMLRNALLAMSLSLVGDERKDAGMANEAMRYYSKALGALRAKLDVKSTVVSKSKTDDSCVMACLACAMYEMLGNRSWLFLLNHVRGISALLELRGVENLHSAPSRKAFYEYRVMDIIVCLTTRRASFLGLPEWVNTPWGESDPHASYPIHTLINSAYVVPALMERVDRFMMQRDKTNVSMDRQTLNRFLQEGMEILKSLNSWEIDLHGGDPTTQLWVARLTDSSRFPGTQNKCTQNQVYTVSYGFPNFSLATALVYYETFRISIYRLLIDVSQQNVLIHQDNATGDEMVSIREDILLASCMHSADMICQSTEYFFEKSKRIKGKLAILFPFKAARDVLNYLTRIKTGIAELDDVLPAKLRFCDQIIEQFTIEGLSLWQVINQAENPHNTQ